MLPRMLVRVARKLPCLQQNVWRPFSIAVAAIAMLFVSVSASGCFRSVGSSFPEYPDDSEYRANAGTGYRHVSARGASHGQMPYAESAESGGHMPVAYPSRGPEHASFSEDLTSAHGLGHALTPADAAPSGTDSNRIASDGVTSFGVASTVPSFVTPDLLVTDSRNIGGLHPLGARGSSKGASLSLSPLDPSVIPDGPGCLAMLDSLGVRYEIPLPKPNMRTAVLVTGDLGGVTYQGYAPGALLCDCRLAVALAWLGPDFAAVGITAVRYSGAYVYRMSRVGRLSMHAWGLAIDIHEVVLSTGRETVSRDYVKGLENPCLSSKPLNQLVCRMRARRIFRELLTPDYNADHHDHLHVSIRVHGDDPVGAKLYQASKAKPSKPAAGKKGKRSRQTLTSAVDESRSVHTAGSKLSDDRPFQAQAAKDQLSSDKQARDKQAKSQLNKDDVIKSQRIEPRGANKQAVEERPTKDKAQANHVSKDQLSKEPTLTGARPEVARAQKAKESTSKGKIVRIGRSGDGQGVAGGEGVKEGNATSGGVVTTSKDAKPDKSRTKASSVSARAGAAKALKDEASSNADTPEAPEAPEVSEVSEVSDESGAPPSEPMPKKASQKTPRKRGKARVHQRDTKKDSGKPSAVPSQPPPSAPSPPNVRGPKAEKRSAVS